MTKEERKFTQLTSDGAVLEINGEEKVFDSEIILVTYHAKEGQHVSSDKGIVVSLDLTFTARAAVPKPQRCPLSRRRSRLRRAWSVC